MITRAAGGSDSECHSAGSALERLEQPELDPRAGRGPGRRRKFKFGLPVTQVASHGHGHGGIIRRVN
jgi:hypothetical protein